MHVWLKIVAIGTIHECFRQNSCNWPILYTFQLKELQLAQTMRISVEIVVISSDCVHFRCNRCNWLRSFALQLKSL